MTDPAIVRILLYGALGALVGVAFISALDWNVLLYVERNAGPKAPLVHMTRLLVTGAIFTLAAREGAVALLSTLAGFQMSRIAAVNRNRAAIGRNP